MGSPVEYAAPDIRSMRRVPADVAWVPHGVATLVGEAISDAQYPYAVDPPTDCIWYCACGAPSDRHALE